MLRTEYVLHMKFLSTGLIPCFGQCGVVSCPKYATSVAALRRHIKKSSEAALRYSELNPVSRVEILMPAKIWYRLLVGRPIPNP